MNKKLISIALIACALMSLGTVSGDAENVDVSVTINNIPPFVLNNTTGPLNIDPEVQYTINTTVIELNRISDLVTIEIKLYYGSDTSGNGRNYYSWTWTNPSPGTAPAVADFTNTANWSESVTGTYISTTNVIIGLFNRSVTFDLNWQVVGIARPTASDYWHYHIEATDTSNPSSSSAQGDAQVSKFLSFSVQSSTLPFGNVDPGAAVTPTNDNVVSIVSNGEVDISVTGASLTAGVYTIPVGQFYVEDSGSVQTFLTAAAQTIYDDYRDVDEGGVPDAGILGYSNSTVRTLLFGGSIPDPQEVGTYTGTWIIDVTNVCTPAN